MANLSELLQPIRAALSAPVFDVGAFDAALDKLAAYGEAGIVAAGYSLLDDRFALDGPMFRVVHVMEDAPDPVYVAEILAVAAFEIPRAPRWSSILFMRIMNSSATKSELIRQLPSALPEARAAIKLLLEEINREGPEFLAKTVPVMVAVG